MGSKVPIVTASDTLEAVPGSSESEAPEVPLLIVILGSMPDSPVLAASEIPVLVN